MATDTVEQKENMGAFSAHVYAAFTCRWGELISGSPQQKRFQKLFDGFELDSSLLIDCCKNAKVKMLAAPDDFNDGNLNFGFDTQKNNKYLLSVEIQLKSADSVHSYFKHVFDNKFPDESIRKLYLGFVIRSYLEFLLQNVYIACHLSSGGSFIYHSSYCVVDQEKHNTNITLSNFWMLDYVEKKHSLRILREMDFSDTWDWYSNLAGVFKGVAKTPVELGLCNFISLTHGSDDVTGGKNLVWAFAGIEAILAESESGIVSQLRNKFIAIFGNHVDIKNFDKIIRDLYKERSQIIHGKKERVSSLTSSNYFLHGSSAGDDMYIAILLLVATLQYCCQNRVSEIKFRTVVV